eukprot:TRINITY_DN7587_c0_g1_i1.p3 TRINITY_DN7587_c0_g1~~TRINITY_DN7587_c0_g1_i1.p3  ORF type:complete len:145 (+),score=21.58 TRINITY_DN7587_c0_g1_i1:149-583(+)
MVPLQQPPQQFQPPPFPSPPHIRQNVGAEMMSPGGGQQVAPPGPIPMRSFTMQGQIPGGNLPSPQANGRLPPHLLTSDSGIDGEGNNMVMMQSSLPPHLNVSPVRPPPHHFVDPQQLPHPQSPQGQGQGQGLPQRHHGIQPQTR